MSKPFIKIELFLNNETASNVVGNWLQNKVDEYPKVRGGFVVIDPPEANPDSEFYRITIHVSLTSSADRLAIFNALKSKAQESGVVPYLESVKVWSHECNHGTPIREKCVNVLVYNWSKS